MAGFGDNSTSFQRHAVLPQGGMIIEAGCITLTAADYTDLRIPTKMTKVISVVCSGSGTVENIGCISIACVSGSTIVAKVGPNTPVSQIVNYIACGY